MNRSVIWASLPAMFVAAMLLANCGGGKPSAPAGVTAPSRAPTPLTATATVPPATAEPTATSTSSLPPLSLPSSLVSVLGTSSAPTPASVAALPNSAPVSVVDVAGPGGIGVSQTAWDTVHRLDPSDISAERSRSYDRQPDGTDRYTQIVRRDGRVIGYTVHFAGAGIGLDPARQQVQADFPPDATKVTEQVVGACGAILHYRSASLGTVFPFEQGVLTVSLASTNSDSGAYDPARISLARVTLGNLDDGSAC